MWVSLFDSHGRSQLPDGSIPTRRLYKLRLQLQFVLPDAFLFVEMDGDPIDLGKRYHEFNAVDHDELNGTSSGDPVWIKEPLRW